jgi:hypothetical protein
MGGKTVIKAVARKLVRIEVRQPGFVAGKSGNLMPISTTAGPPRLWRRPDFELTDENSRRMAGANAPLYERWSDIAGNYYSSEFVAGFDYSSTGPNGPVVRLRVEPEAETFMGRIEARRLKPNFVYQMKLSGVFSDMESLEAIGYAGRWRLRGPGTNYTDDQYRKLVDKSQVVEAYVYFDYLLTDREGNAARNFELDSSLHITWNASRQRSDAQVAHVYPAIVRASDPEFYAVPKLSPTVEFLWLERERIRYESGGEKIRLPPGDYTAELVLTEESFHSRDNDGGFWATVYSCPVEFTVVSAVTTNSTVE